MRQAGPPNIDVQPKGGQWFGSSRRKMETSPKMGCISRYDRASTRLLSSLLLSTANHESFGTQILKLEISNWVKSLFTHGGTKTAGSKKVDCTNPSITKRVSGIR